MVIFREGILLDGFSVDEMLLDDAFEHFGRARVIPNAFRIDDGDRSLCADAEAIDFASIDQRLRANEVQFLEPLFQVVPRLQAALLRRAFGLGLVGAQENVPPVLFQTERLGEVMQFARHAGLCRARKG
jgi:hypothetical protein